ncbi:hypothetical protein [Amycolatopsis sp. MEPSY49]
MGASAPLGLVLAAGRGAPIEADEFDMIAVGCPLPADPAWAAKILTGL